MAKYVKMFGMWKVNILGGANTSLKIQEMFGNSHKSTFKDHKDNVWKHKYSL